MDSVYRGVSDLYETVVDIVGRLEATADTFVSLVDSTLSYLLPQKQSIPIPVTEGGTSFPGYQTPSKDLEGYAGNSDVPHMLDNGYDDRDVVDGLGMVYMGRPGDGKKRRKGGGRNNKCRRGGRGGGCEVNVAKGKRRKKKSSGGGGNSSGGNSSGVASPQNSGSDGNGNEVNICGKMVSRHLASRLDAGQLASAYGLQKSMVKKALRNLRKQGKI